MRRVVLLAIALISQVLAAAEDLPENIRIGYPGVGVGGRPAIGGSVPATVHNLHLLEKEFTPSGVRVEWSLNKGAGPAINEQFANHQLDMAYLGDLAAIIGRSVGIDTKIVLSGGRGANLYLAVPAKSPFKTLEDVKGKRLAVFKGTALQLQGARLFAQRGLSEADFSSISLEHSAGLAAIISGDIDALWVQAPIYEFVERGDVRIIASSRDVVAGQPRITSFGVFVVGTDFAARYPKAVQRVVEVLVRQTAIDSDEHRREAIFENWATSGVPALAFRQEFAGDVLAERFSPLLDDGFIQEIQQGIVASVKAKLIRRSIPVDDWIDRSYLDRALETQGLTNRWKPVPAIPSP